MNILSNRLPTALLALSCCFVSGVCAEPAEALNVRAELTVGEHSKDSSSHTTVIAVSDDKVVWEETESGARHRSGKDSARRKVFKLSAAQKQNVQDAIAANELLVSESIMLPQRPPVFYFALRMKLTVGTAEGAIEIEGPRSAREFRGSKLYERSMNVMKALYAVMNAHDKSMIFEEPVRAER